MYEMNEYMCMACDKGMMCPVHKLRKMNDVLIGTLQLEGAKQGKDIRARIDPDLLTESMKNGKLATDIFFAKHQAQLLDV